MRRILFHIKKHGTFLIKKIKRNWIIIIIGGILTFLIFLKGSYESVEWVVSLSKTSFGCTREVTLFPDSGYNVLIIPFHAIDKSNQRDWGFVIKERLVKLSDKNSLDLNVHYYLYDASVNFNSDSAKYLCEKYNADLLIYGNYNDCIGDSNEICINHYNSDELPFTKDISIFHADPVKATVNDIREGSFQGNIDLIIYWIAGISEYNIGNYELSKKDSSTFIKMLKGNFHLFIDI